MIEYFNRMAELLQPKYRFEGKTKDDFNAWKQQLLAELKKLLGPMPERVPLNPQNVWEIREDGLIKRRVIIDLEENMSVAALVYVPEVPVEFPSGSISPDGVPVKKPMPAILCNHGHGQFGKDSVMGVRVRKPLQRKEEIYHYNFDYGLQMAQHGYVTMAIDYRGFGERSDGGNPYVDKDKCNVHFIRGSLMGVNLLALDIFDAMRCIDYLCELECVDAERIGTMGISFGGTMTTWTALLDERIKAADIICYSCMFENFAVQRGNFCGSQYLPGLFSLCNVPDLHGLIAPRPLLAEIGVHDKCFLCDEALQCSREVSKIYTAAGVGNNYEVDIFGGGHEFAANKAFDFFDRYLKDT